jgi:5-methylcytosine-specific restriction endonuclease McrA
MAMKKVPLKRKPGTLKFTPLKKGGMIKRKISDRKHLIDRKEEGEKLWQLFEEHWRIKPHICQSCNCKLFGENKSIYHDHLLEHGRERYEHLKFEMDNLFLVCFDCHTKKGNGYPEELHQKAIENAKKMFDVT